MLMCVTNCREQVNQVTSFLDASMLYGSDENVAKILRAHTGLTQYLQSCNTILTLPKIVLKYGYVVDGKV
jgi:hypothetical protein